MGSKNGTKPEIGTRRKKGGKFLARFFFWLGALVVSTGLALIAIYSWAASLGALTAIAMLVLVLVSRRARKEREATPALVAAAARDRETVVEVLFGALGLRDMRMTQAEQVANLAATVAWQMGLREEEVRRVKGAALLHDVGKMGIADSVLSKPGQLNDEERAAMRRHPEAGFAILEQIESLRHVAPVIHHHHERFDGQGYPDGLRGDDIPIGARIFAVADSYVAMTSDRPYRRKLPHEIAVQEIVRNALTQFDPEVVSAFLQAEKQGLVTGRQQPRDGSIRKAVSTEV
ncbi:MAG TPA: HD-GYP domain-containing protein [Dehalococcoidia bacterium]|nr:HD-GYP domain-containing protein [Dehalococcoidia bacterium]